MVTYVDVSYVNASYIGMKQRFVFLEKSCGIVGVLNGMRLTASQVPTITFLKKIRIHAHLIFVHLTYVTKLMFT